MNNYNTTLLSLKKEKIMDAVRSSFDMKWLKEHCITTHGLIDNEVRLAVWPLLVDKHNPLSSIDQVTIESHSSFNQVKLDVDRIDSLLPSDMSEEDKSKTRAQMMRLVVSVLIDNPSVYYYQGFHDICYIFLSVLGEETARSVLNSLVLSKLNVFMEKTMDSTLHYMQLIFALLGYLRPELTAQLEDVGLGPHFAVSWIVTWFAHVLPKTDDVRRLFDLFLASDPLMLIYLSVSVIIKSDDEVQSTSDDFGMLHHTLLRLPKRHPVEDLVKHAIKLSIAVPPEKLLELGRCRRALLATGAKGDGRLAKPVVRYKRLGLYMGAILSVALAYLVYRYRYLW